jgi:hypothetical protein
VVGGGGSDEEWRHRPEGDDAVGESNEQPRNPRRCSSPNPGQAPSAEWLDQFSIGEEKKKRRVAQEKKTQVAEVKQEKKKRLAEEKSLTSDNDRHLRGGTTAGN